MAPKIIVKKLTKIDLSKEFIEVKLGNYFNYY
jgi:hypothetical protein